MEESYKKPSFKRTRPAGFYGENLEFIDNTYCTHSLRLSNLRSEVLKINASLLDPQRKNELREKLNSKIEFSKLVVDLVQNGVDFEIVMVAIAYPFNTEFQKENFSFIQNFPEAKKFLQDEKSIKDSIKTLKSGLKFIFCGLEQTQHINLKVLALADSLKGFDEILNDFLDFRLYEESVFDVALYLDIDCDLHSLIESKEPDEEFDSETLQILLDFLSPKDLRKYVTQGRKLTGKTRRFWSGLFLVVVNELTDAGYSDNSAYKITAKLFSHAWPDYLGALTGEQVRKRCEYEKKMGRENSNS